MITLMVDFESIAQEANGSVVGKIWLSFEGNQVFPHGDWYDFPLLILARIIKGMPIIGREEYEIFFYDGPVSFRVFEDRFELIKSEKKIGEVFVSKEEIKDFLDNALDSAKKIFDVMKLKKFTEGSQLKELRSALQNSKRPINPV